MERDLKYVIYNMYVQEQGLHLQVISVIQDVDHHHSIYKLFSAMPQVLVWLKPSPLRIINERLDCLSYIALKLNLIRLSCPPVTKIKSNIQMQVL